MTKVLQHEHNVAFFNECGSSSFYLSLSRFLSLLRSFLSYTHILEDMLLPKPQYCQCLSEKVLLALLSSFLSELQSSTTTETNR